MKSYSEIAAEKRSEILEYLKENFCDKETAFNIMVRAQVHAALEFGRTRSDFQTIVLSMIKCRDYLYHSANRSEKYEQIIDSLYELADSFKDLPHDRALF